MALRGGVAGTPSGPGRPSRGATTAARQEGIPGPHTERHKPARIWRIATGLWSSYLSKYGHPNGWNIVQCERTWSERGGPQGIPVADRPPKRWWEVYRRYDKRRTPVHTATTLRAARAWCDAHKAPVQGSK